MICIILKTPLKKKNGCTVKPLAGEIIFTDPSARAGYDTRSIFKRSLTGLNSEFSFSKTSCRTKAEEPSLPNYLPIARGRIIGFIPFPRVLVLCEMQWISSRIWTRVAVSISYDDNHYTTGTSWHLAGEIRGVYNFPNGINLKVNENCAPGVRTRLSRSCSLAR